MLVGRMRIQCVRSPIAVAAEHDGVVVDDVVHRHDVRAPPTTRTNLPIGTVARRRRHSSLGIASMPLRRSDRFTPPMVGPGPASK